jgi:hypothetical protein
LAVSCSNIEVHFSKRFFMTIKDLDPQTRAFVCDVAEDVLDILAIRHPGSSSEPRVRNAIVAAISEMASSGTRDPDVLCAYGLTMAIETIAG